jgi:hypothetical protein
VQRPEPSVALYWRELLQHTEISPLPPVCGPITRPWGDIEAFALTVAGFGYRLRADCLDGRTSLSGHQDPRKQIPTTRTDRRLCFA